jgi:glycosyltransferase involved in cell wall biosynthesis
MQNRAIVSADALVFDEPTEGEAGGGGFIHDAIAERRTPAYATRGGGARDWVDRGGCIRGVSGDHGGEETNRVGSAGPSCRR